MPVDRARDFLAEMRDIKKSECDVVKLGAYEFLLDAVNDDVNVDVRQQRAIVGAVDNMASTGQGHIATAKLAAVAGWINTIRLPRERDV